MRAFGLFAQLLLQGAAAGTITPLRLPAELPLPNQIQPSRVTADAPSRGVQAKDAGANACAA